MKTTRKRIDKEKDQELEGKPKKKKKLERKTLRNERSDINNAIK